MLHKSKLPEIFWSEAVNTAVYIRNRSPTNIASNENGCITSHECYLVRKLSLGHIRPLDAMFGCMHQMRSVPSMKVRVRDISRLDMWLIQPQSGEFRIMQRSDRQLSGIKAS